MVELKAMKHISSFLFIASLFFGLGVSQTVSAQTATSSTSTVHNAAMVEAEVRKVFADSPAMVEIARCESKFRQFTDSGNPLRGGAGGQMIGVFQFFESVHNTAARSLGFDLSTLEGNLGYARHVYETQGTTPWNSARSCWEIPAAAAITTATTPATPSLSQDKAELQKQITLLLELISVLETLIELKQQLALR